MAEKTAKPASTQSHLPLVGVENGVVIMHDGSYRAIISVGSTNFMLKSEQEQNALIMAYQNFLNSLNYSIQIVMQSRSLDLEPYLKQLESTTVGQKNELIKTQTTDYVAYVRELITVANIMDKKFFVVISYSPVVQDSKSLFAGLFKSKAPSYLKISESQFNIHREELMQRANVVASGLASFGLKTTVLDSDGIIRSLYNTYNFDIAASERVEQPTELTENIISTENKTT
ncbi:MAG: TraC family protein [Patescibacteria group bacterium]|jgi:hypothetical protein